MDASKLGIGSIIETEQQKDAIHMAIAPMTAAEKLSPGDPVALGESGAREAIMEKGVGIVDPFLSKSVRKGERFWLFLYPGTITGLRHEWTHPAFGGAQQPTLDPVEQSKEWLTDVAQRCGVDYERMMDCMESDDYINMGDNEQYKNVLESLPEGEMERHFQIVRGKKPLTTYPFNCSC